MVTSFYHGEKNHYGFFYSSVQLDFTINHTNTDALGDAYEILLPSTLKGESGQFFTPREIVRFAMDVINPQYKNSEVILEIKTQNLIQSTAA